MATTMTSIERMSRILKRQPVDRIGVYEHFWSDTRSTWEKQGHIQENESFSRHFGYDMDECWAFRMVGDLDFKPVVIHEDEETITTRNGNYATLRQHKLHDSTPEHIAFDITDRKSWETFKEMLTPSERRINFKAYEEKKDECQKDNRFFAWSGVNVFELMHPVAGHMDLLIGMADDPDWITDMANTYADLSIHLMEILFAKCGKPDGLWFYEDMGFKERPFMSPAMYKELIFPAHKKTIDFAHSQGLPVILHSCGFVEPLLPGLVEAGIDCLQTMEIKAGMDLLRIYKNYGDRLSFMGGIDVREIISNDKSRIDAELTSKIPVVKSNYGFVLHSDHSIPKDVDYETYKYFIEKGLELGQF